MDIAKMFEYLDGWHQKSRGPGMARSIATIYGLTKADSRKIVRDWQDRKEN